MKETVFSVISNQILAHDIYKMVLGGDTSAIRAPGQFINIKLDGLYLRRPISVCDYNAEQLTIIYKVVGKGTELMKHFAADEKVSALVGLGNGFNSRKSGQYPLLVGGGVGVPPLYGLCKQLLAEGKSPTVVLGFNTQADVFYEQEFKELGAKVWVATADGSYGERGFVTDVMRDLEYSYFYTCGPEPMLKAIDKIAKTSGQLSFEARMGCGFGACMGCSCKTIAGTKRICKEGPILEREELIWEN